MLLLKIVHHLADNIALRSDPLMKYFIKTIGFTLESIRALPEFADLVNSHPEVAIAVCMSVCVANKPPWCSDPEAYQPIRLEFMIESKPRLTTCVSYANACSWVGTPCVRCKLCQATWEDQRTRYDKCKWRYYCCRACGQPESPDTLVEVYECPKCRRISTEIPGRQSL